MPTITQVEDDKHYRVDIVRAFKIGAHLFRPGMYTVMRGAIIKTIDPENLNAQVFEVDAL
jgi:hypothetical protein